MSKGKKQFTDSLHRTGRVSLLNNNNKIIHSTPESHTRSMHMRGAKFQRTQSGSPEEGRPKQKVKKGHAPDWKHSLILRADQLNKLIWGSYFDFNKLFYPVVPGLCRPSGREKRYKVFSNMHCQTTWRTMNRRYSYEKKPLLPSPSEPFSSESCKKISGYRSETRTPYRRSAAGDLRVLGPRGSR